MNLGRGDLAQKCGRHGVGHKPPLMFESVICRHDNEGSWEQSLQDIAEKVGSIEFLTAQEYVLALSPVRNEDYWASEGTNEELHDWRVQLDALVRKPDYHFLGRGKVSEHARYVSKKTICGRLVMGDALDGLGECGKICKVK